MDERDGDTSQFRSESLHELHREIIQCQFSPMMGFPELEQQPSVLLFDIDVQPLTDKDIHLLVQPCDPFPERPARGMYRLLLHQIGISEEGVTQEPVVVPRDEIVPFPVGIFHDKTRQRFWLKRGVQKRGTAPPGAVILSFLSVP